MQQERLTELLHDIAVRGVPETGDPWPGIRAHVADQAAVRQRPHLPTRHIGRLAALAITGAGLLTMALLGTAYAEQPVIRGGQRISALS